MTAESGNPTGEEIRRIRPQGPQGEHPEGRCGETAEDTRGFGRDRHAFLSREWSFVGLGTSPSPLIVYLHFSLVEHVVCLQSNSHLPFVFCFMIWNALRHVGIVEYMTGKYLTSLS